MFKLFFLVVLTTSFIGLNVAHAGYTSSAGTLFIGYDQNPWFIGKSEATYCVEKAPEFSLDMTESLFVIDLVLKDWESTIQQIKETPLSLGGVPQFLTKRFSRASECSAAVDLRILLGTSHPEVKKALGDRRGVMGFAHRSSYDFGTGRSKGFIWISPDSGPMAQVNFRKDFWTSSRALYLAMLHEVGHVFGIHHNTAAFMDDSAPIRVVKNINKLLSTSDTVKQFSVGLNLYPYYVSSNALLMKRRFSSSFKGCLNGKKNSLWRSSTFEGEPLTLGSSPIDGTPIFSSESLEKTTSYCVEFDSKRNAQRIVISVSDAAGRELESASIEPSRGGVFSLNTDGPFDVYGYYPQTTMDPIESVPAHKWIAFQSIASTKVKVTTHEGVFQGVVSEVTNDALSLSVIRNGELETFEFSLPRSGLRNLLQTIE